MFTSKIGSTVSNITHNILPKLKPTKIPANSSDVVEVQRFQFAPIEQRLMTEVRQYTQKHGVETARVVNKNGRKLDVTVTESAQKAEVFPKNIDFEPKNRKAAIKSAFKKIKYMTSLWNCSFIHSHPYETPLSGLDVFSMLKMGAKKMIATTPSGGCSSLEMPSTLTFLTHGPKIVRAAIKISKLQEMKLKELNLVENGAYNFEKISSEQLKEYNDFSINLLQDFADRFRLKFQHNLSGS